MTAVEHVQVVGLHQATTAEELLDLLDALRPAWHADAACRERDDARLRKLDRIEAALGDVWTADEIRWAVGDGRVVKMAYYPLDEMLRRLADALEDTDG